MTKKRPKKSAVSAVKKIGAGLRNRIVGNGEEDPEKILANPKNWRTHSNSQASAVDGLLDEVGWVNSVIVNRTTGRLMDGHLRVELAKKRKEATIPVVYVALSQKEEDLVLAMLDPLGDLAGLDQKKLDALLTSLTPESVALQKLIAQMEEELGVGKDEGEAETLLDQAIQMEPGKEFVIVMAANPEEWTALKARLGLRTVRRGGYKPGSAFDAEGTDRVVKAAKLFKLLKAAR